MKPNFKILDQTDPELVNAKLNDAILAEISSLLRSRRTEKDFKSKAPAKETQISQNTSS